MTVSGNYSNNGNGDMFGDLRAQEAASINRTIEPSSPEEFLKWVRQELRDQRNAYNKLFEEHIKLTKAGELATVGLTRLGNLVKLNNRIQYEMLMNLHRDFTFKEQNIGYTLEKCRAVLDETTMNMQFAGETLAAPLADRHKKIAVQKELGLRLRDTDADFNRSEQAVGAQQTKYTQLAEGIQNLMHQTSIKLPPKIRETINREDEIARLAIMHKKSLEKGNDVINSKAYIPPKDTKKLRILGETSATLETKADTPLSEKIPATESPFDVKIALASTTIGIIVGVLIFYVILAK